MIYALSILTAILLWIDRNQTLQIKDHPKLHEVNILLGKHPSDTKITSYFVLCVLAALAAPAILPTEWTLGILGSVSVLQAFVIYHNYKNKLKIKLW